MTQHFDHKELVSNSPQDTYLPQRTPSRLRRVLTIAGLSVGSALAAGALAGGITAYFERGQLQDAQSQIRCGNAITNNQVAIVESDECIQQITRIVFPEDESRVPSSIAYELVQSGQATQEVAGGPTSELQSAAHTALVMMCGVATCALVYDGSRYGSLQS